MAVYIVTGGAGFIGSHLVRHLAELGNSVRVLDNFSTGSRQNLLGLGKEVEIVEGDVRDPVAIHGAARNADYVIHLAAQISVPASVEDPITTDEINTRGTLNVLVAARDGGARRFVLASSCAVYGDSPHLPMREDDPPAPLSPYAVSKLAAEHYCQAFHQLYGLPTVALRYFNVFGPGQRADSPYAAVIPRFEEAVAAGRAPTVHGDGRQTRDFVYIDNVVEATVLACQSDRAAGRVINIGSGRETSVNELTDALSRIAGREIVASYAPPRPGDIRRSVGDISLAHDLLGYECPVSLEDGLGRTFEFFVGKTRPE
jgi:UDP-glucose 4-epimerase